MSKKDIPIRVPGKGVVGVVRGNLFIKKVHAHIHFLEIPPAIANDISVLRDAEKAGATICLIIDLDTKKKYYASFKQIWKIGFEFNRGHGDQIGLPMKYWSTDLPVTQETFL
jgi:hypothetical protein